MSPVRCISRTAAILRPVCVPIANLVGVEFQPYGFPVGRARRVQSNPEPERSAPGAAYAELVAERAEAAALPAGELRGQRPAQPVEQMLRVAAQRLEAKDEFVA